MTRLQIHLSGYARKQACLCVARRQAWRGMLIALLLALSGTAGRAQEFAIQAFDKANARIVFDAVGGATNYSVQTASTPTGTWSVAVGTIPPTAANTVTATVSVAAATAFYRVVAEVTPAPLFNMVLIPAGTNRGIDPDYGRYTVAVESFYMDQYEVTKAQWDEVYTWAITNGYTFAHAGSGKGANHPVQMVSWHDCVKWCNARSEKEGRPVSYRVAGAVYRGADDNGVAYFADVAGYRLPTLVEHLYASLGGVNGKRFYWGDTIDHTQANYYGYPASSGGHAYDVGYAGYDTGYATGEQPYTSPVGSFAANGYGLYDMAGNIFEWCTDRYPHAENMKRVLRGGSWSIDAAACRVAQNYGYWSNYASKDAGFRTVLPLGQ